MSKDYKFEIRIKGTVRATDMFKGEAIMKRAQEDMLDIKLAKYNNVITDLRKGATVIFGNQN